nr:MAG TPA: PGDYG protein [Caudoviricetes sp.]
METYFIKKRIPVSAFQLGYQDMPLWFQGAIKDNFVSNIDVFLASANEVIKIKTLEGIMTAQKGDWIIRGIKGEIYPCKDEIFRETYDFVNLTHIKVGDNLADKMLYIDEINYLGILPEDIVVIDENHKIVTEKDADGKITKMKLIDTNEDSGEIMMLYDNGKRVQDRILIPKTFGEVTKIQEDSIAYEILKIEATIKETPIIPENPDEKDPEENNSEGSI